jgi:hypothetical protein
VAIRDSSVTASKARFGAVKRAEEDEMGGGGHSMVVRSSYRRKRRWTVAAAKPWVQQSGGGCSSKAIGVVGRHCSDRVIDRWVPRGFTIFQNIQNWLKFVKSKWMPYLAKQIPSFCMSLDCNVLNNFLNCADLKFPTKIK